MTRSDASLLKRYAKGDAAAFEQLYARHKNPLYNYLYRSLGNSALTEEIAQDVWLAVIKSATTYQQQNSAFRTWLYTIGRNRIIDYQRRRANQAHADIDDISAAHPGLAAEDQMLLKQLLRALQQLPDDQRETLILQQEGFSQREISEITGVGGETVKSRLRYARAALKRQMGAQ